MISSSGTKEREPVWWTAEYTIVWETVEPLLKADFDRRSSNRYRSELKQQGVNEPVHHDVGVSVTPRNIDVDRAHRVPDEDWELGVEWDQIRPALRFGVGARAKYPNARWTQELETRIKDDYCQTYEPSTWERVRNVVRRGFEFQGDRPS